MAAPPRLSLTEPSGFRVMPWKNGGGATTELAIEPPGATVAGGFLWRLSMAAVADSGPFSRFPGVNRTLLLLDGPGLDLDHGPHGRVRLEGPLVPVDFPGEWDTQGTLLGGPCQDFNVMSDRTRIRHRVTVLRPGPGGLRLPEAPVLLAFCPRGAAFLPALGVALAAQRLLRLDGGGTAPFQVCAPDPDTAVIFVEIHDK